MPQTLKPALTVGIFGVGKSTLAVVEYFKKQSFNFKLNVRSDCQITSFPSFPDARIYSEADACSKIDEDVLFLSPSVRRDRREFADAEARGTILTSETELFFNKCSSPVYAVTGSDGKSTTAYLIASMLKHSGQNAAAAGNFGLPLISLLDSGITAAAELSSFQLMYLQPSCHRAVITNITPNHLNWHKSMDEYISSKLNIAKRCDGLIIDFDCRSLREATSNIPIFAAVSSVLDYKAMKELIKAENYITRDENTVYLNGKEYFSQKGAIRRESYNMKNYMLAAAALIGKIDRFEAEAAINAFGGLPHRKETVLEREGMTYINSSIDSTPERTIKTLKSLSGRVAVIIGGRGKGLSLDELSGKLPSLTCGACLLGEVGIELYELLKRNKDYTAVVCDGMEDAVKKGEAMLNNNGTLILSPAATSFDKYKNFEERGTDFKNIVTKK